ncbi:MAG TPA: hypothetical protein VED46_09940 [Alphaproteobacteria bacterium]|nr:hypothetical protein [Alphaproteobacteria bacterium]HXV82997.1 hypothetical protein [Candidatus Binatia bacterium]
MIENEERRAAALLGKAALVKIATGRISRQEMINEAREACIALRWRFGEKAMQRLLERTNGEGQSPGMPLSSNAA